MVLVAYTLDVYVCNRPIHQAVARKDPNRIFSAYFELAPGQFVEFFPRQDGQLEHDVPWNSELGYSHYALTVDDIHATRAGLEEKAESDIDCFFGGGTTSFLENDVEGLDDFELVCFLAVRPC